MNNKKNKIAIITNIIPTYREHFYDIVLNNKEYDVNTFNQINPNTYQYLLNN